MDTRIDLAALDRYLAGEANAAELADIERWMAGEPGRSPTALSQALERASSANQPSADLRSADAVWDRVRPSVHRTSPCHPNDLNAKGEPIGPRASTSIRITRPRFPWRIAAACIAVAVVIVGALVVSNYSASSSRDTTLSNTYRTALGQQVTIPLGNGSVMRLAPATTARVTPGLVILTGEALFTIAPNSTRPFVVQTAQARVEVLGTTFIVRHYADESRSRVVVDEGKVAVRTLRGGMRQPPTVAVARTLADVTDSGVVVTPNVAMDEYAGWVSGRLTFTEVPLRDVLRELERAYGAEIRLADTTLATFPMTMAASVRKDPLPDVLDFVSRAVNAHVTREARAFLIVPGRSVAHPIRRAMPRSNSQPETQYGR